MTVFKTILLALNRDLENLIWSTVLRIVFLSTVYVIDVETANKPGAGTDAHVFLTMFGKRGKTPKTQLVNRYVVTDNAMLSYFNII